MRTYTSMPAFFFPVFLALAFLLAAVFTAPAAFAQEATFSVDTTADAVDANPGDGACATEDGSCTLRAAIQEGNAQSGPQSILLPAGTYTLDLSADSGDGAEAGDLAVTGNIRVIGGGRDATIVDAGGIDRVFRIAEDATLDLSGVTVRNGAAQQGGGILNAGELVLTDSAVTGNTSLSGGGGIYNLPGATAILSNVDVSGNVAERSERGGGILNAGRLKVQSGTISGNTAISGGGVHNAGTLIAIGTVISGNDAVGGGGIDNADGGAATLVAVTINANEASYGGGIVSEGRLLLIDSSVNGNAPSNCSGGIWVIGEEDACPDATPTPGQPATTP